MRRTHRERAILQRIEEQHVAGDGAAILVATSGGPDSVALASLLSRLAPAHGWRIVLGHVNHHVRASSWQDECVVLAVAAALGVRARIEGLSRAVDRQARSEAVLRERRYAALEAMARAEGAPVVVTAHTAEDQTESVLLALFRGTGPQGLAGISVRRRLAAGIELVRPILEVRRSELHRELGAAALPYVRDPSNADPAYRRNAVRAALSPLREQFPGLDEAVARCAAILREDLAGTARAAARRQLREALAQETALLDVPFERVEAVLRARRGRVFLKPGMEVRVGRRDA